MGSDKLLRVLARYLKGEHVEVWGELVGLGEAAGLEPARAATLAVAREIARRTRENLEVLVPRLNRLGYRFDTVRAPLVLAPADARLTLEALETSGGALPVALRAWYEVMNGVSLIGSHPDWPPVETLDPLCVDPFDGTYLDALKRDYFEKSAHPADESGDIDIDIDVDLSDQTVSSFMLAISPSARAKAGFDVGPPYSVALPSRSADAPLLYDWHGTTFVGYLRECFRWGGFPGLARVDARERAKVPLNLLTAGLLPF